MVSYAAEEEIRVRQSNQQLLHNNNFNYQSSNQSSQIMHASPDGFSNKIGKELPPLHDDVNESQDSVVLQQSTQTSNQMKAMIQQYKEQPEPRLMQHRAVAQQQFLQPAGTNVTSTGMHKRSQDRLPTANRNQQHQQQQQVVKQMKQTGHNSERQMFDSKNNNASSSVDQGHFIDRTNARTSHENEPFRPSDLNTYQTEAQREVRPLQARENDPTAQKQAQAMESRRKLMEELLSLKQEVTQLRKAAEQNEEEAGEQHKPATNSSTNNAILAKFKDQIQALRIS